MKTKSSKTGLFLMELIVAILFFSLAAAICIQLFVKSHLISEHSVVLNQSILLCQNAAEAFYGCDGDLQEIEALLSPGAEGTALQGDSELFLSYANHLNLHITLSKQDNLLSCDISASQEENPSSTEIYSLHTALYQKGN